MITNIKTIRMICEQLGFKTRLETIRDISSINETEASIISIQTQIDSGSSYMKVSLYYVQIGPITINIKIGEDIHLTLLMSQISMIINQISIRGIYYTSKASKTIDE